MSTNTSDATPSKRVLPDLLTAIDRPPIKCKTIIVHNVYHTKDWTHLESFLLQGWTVINQERIDDSLYVSIQQPITDVD